MVKRAIEMSYTSTCNIYGTEKVLSEDKSIEFREILVFADLKCKLSSKSTNKSSETSTYSSLNKEIKLFLDPNIKIKAGSKIEVTTSGVTCLYKNSGEPVIYPNHQEIVLELYEDKA